MRMCVNNLHDYSHHPGSGGYCRFVCNMHYQNEINFISALTEYVLSHFIFLSSLYKWYRHYKIYMRSQKLEFVIQKPYNVDFVRPINEANQKVQCLTHRVNVVGWHIISATYACTSVSIRQPLLFLCLIFSEWDVHKRWYDKVTQSVRGSTNKSCIVTILLVKMAREWWRM